MNGGWFFSIILMNLFCLIGGYFLQKRALENRVKSLKKQIAELENLVAAIIEEFENVAGIRPENELAPVENLPSVLNLSRAVFSEDLSEMAQSVTDEPFPSESEPFAEAISVQPETEAPKTNEDYRQKIYRLWQSGETVADIAKQLGTGQGEVELALKFQKGAKPFHRVIK